MLCIIQQTLNIMSINYEMPLPVMGGTDVKRGLCLLGDTNKQARFSSDELG